MHSSVQENYIQEKEMKFISEIKSKEIQGSDVINGRISQNFFLMITECFDYALKCII